MKKTYSFILFLLPVLMFAQQTITGTVTDKTNFPLPGSSVVIQGTTKGVVTDIDGNYEIVLDKTPATLVYSYLGFISQEIVVNNQTVLNVSLEEDQQQLDEVVVIGYGSVDKGDLTGSVSTVKPNENVASQSQNLETLLQGKAAGVQVTANGDGPGSAVSIKIRGTGSLTSNTEPLYVIDGVIVNSASEDVGDPISNNSVLTSQGGISGIDPADIESFEVLKDASATAIYGSRGANGVVIITTKKGKKGAAQFRYNTSVTVGNVVRNIDVLSPDEFVNYVNDHPEDKTLGYNASGQIIDVNDPDNALIERVWSDEIYETSVSNKHRISVSGGTEKGDYFIAGGVLNNKGIIPSADAQRMDVSINLNNDLSDKLTLGTKVSAAYTETSQSKGADGLGNTNNSLIRNLIKRAPFENYGAEVEDGDDTIDNPTAWITGYDDDSDEIRIISAMNLDYKISKSLSYKVLFGGDYRNKTRKIWFGSELRKGRLSNGIAGVSELKRFKYNVDNTLTYKKRFNKNHRINAVAGVTYDKLSLQSRTQEATSFLIEDLRADGISFAENFSPVNFRKEGETYLSYLGRVNYTLFNKYSVTATFRADGSSKFAEGRRWGYFPSAALAWNINKENFLKNSNTVNDLKLRLGWGQTGNSNIPNYRYYNQYSNAGLISDISGGGQTALAPSFLPNELLRWETTQQYNAGLDFALFNDRVSGNVDVYQKDSKDLLLDVAVGPSVGFESYYANQGGILNKGFEVGLNVDIVRKDNVKWNVYGNVSVNRNEIKDLGIPESQFGTVNGSAFLGNKITSGRYLRNPVNIFIEGQPTGLFYGFQTNGIIQNVDQLDAAPTGPSGDANQLGDLLFVDQNGDGEINNDDYTILGDPNPDYTYGFGTSFSYKNLTVSAGFNGVYGNEIINGNLIAENDTFRSAQNVRSGAYYNAYSDANPTGTEPRLGYDIDSKTTSTLTDRAIEDGSFLRLSNVTIGYDLPIKNAKNSFIDGANIYVTGTNLYVWTDYSGYDPEVNTYSFDPTRVGIDWNAFPNRRSFSLGLNLTF